MRAGGAHAVDIGWRRAWNQRAGREAEAGHIEPVGGRAWRFRAGIAGHVGALGEVGGRSAGAGRGDGNAGAEVDDGVGGPSAERRIGEPMQVDGAAGADGQVVGDLAGELVLDVLRADGVLEVKVLRILRSAVVGADKAEGRVAVIGDQLGPGEAGQGFKVFGQVFLELGLEGVVLGIAGGIAVDDDAVAGAVAAVAELGVSLERDPKGNHGRAVVVVGGGLDGRPGVGHHLAGGLGGIDAEGVAVLGDLLQGESVEIDAAEGQEKAAAAHVGGAEHDLARHLPLQAEVVVVNGGGALGVQHRGQGNAQVIGQAGGRRGEGGHQAAGEGIGERVGAGEDVGGADAAIAGGIAVEDGVAVTVGAGGVPGGVGGEAVAVERGASGHLRAGAVIHAGAAAEEEIGINLPACPQARAEVGEVGGERRTAAAVHVLFGAGVGNAVGGTLCRGVEVFQAVVALGAAGEDVPAETGGDAEGAGGTPGVLDKAGVVGVGLGLEQILGEVGVVVGLVAGIIKGRVK